MSATSLKPDRATLTVNVPRDGPAKSSSKTPITPTTAKARVLNPKTRVTLEDAWRKAQQQFYEDSGGKDLGSLQGGKHGVLQKWEETYIPEDSNGRRKYDQMKGILNNVLNGVELVGAFAAQALSGIFPPSGMCFNAVQFLIDAPRQIQKVYDGLKELFEEIQQFLVKFKIYQRIDDKFGLDEDLFVNTNNLLIVFVRICGLATKLLHGGKWQSFKTAFNVVLFRNDSGVPGELENFRRLVDRQSTLAGAVTLEHVLQSEESINQVLNDTSELKTNVTMLVAASNDEKTRFVNKDRLGSIEQKLFKKSLSGEENFLATTTDDILPGTFEAIQATAAYTEWADETKSGTTLLFIWGSSGSGKSRMLDAVKDSLDLTRESARRDDPSTYVAAYTFSDKRLRATTNKKTSGSLVPHALKIIALQVARQSTSYAKDLFLQLQKQEKMYSEEDIDKIWSILRLSKFTVPRSSVLYILLDAVELEDIVDLRKLLDLLCESKKDSGEYPKIKVLLTMDATEERITELGQSKGLHILSAKDINQKLIMSFVVNEMLQKGLFQDSDRATRRLRQETMKKITTSLDISFDKVRRKLNNLRDAIENGLPRSEIPRLLQDATNTGIEGEGKGVLRELENTLKPADLALLKTIIKWLMASPWKCMNLSVLEAALRLEEANLPIEPLTKKINNRFSNALTRGGDVVYLNASVEEYLNDTWYHQSSLVRTSADEPLITLNISIKNATQSMVKQFIWSLNEQTANGKFDFGQIQSKNATQLEFDRLTTQLHVTHLCFKLMNEGWEDDTEGMLAYAYTEFARHLGQLRDMEHLINSIERKTIGQDLIAFLTDTYCFDQRHQSYGDGRWMLDSDLTSAVKFWLEDPETQRQLPLKEQRWIQQSLDPSAGPLAFMRSQAISIGQRWLSDWRSESYPLWDWLDSYIVAIDLAKQAEATAEVEAENNAEDQSAAGGNDQDENPDDEAAENGVDSETQNEDQTEQETGPEQINGDAQETSDQTDIKPDDTTQTTITEESANADDSVNLANGNTTAEENRVAPDENIDEQVSDSKDADALVEKRTDPPTDTDESGQDNATDADNVENNDDADKNENSNDSSGSGEEDAADAAEKNDDDSVDHVTRARDWIMAHAKITIDTVYHLTLADTYNEDGQYQRSVEEYNQAAENPELKHYALYGLSTSHLALGNDEAMLECANESLSIFKSKADSNMLDAFDTKNYVAYTKHWASVFEERKNLSKALELYGEAWKRKPDDLMCFWNLLKLHCMVDDTQEEALRLIEEWVADEDKFGGQSPSLSILEVAEQDEYDTQLMPLALNIKNEKLREHILEVTHEALRLAGRSPITGIHGRLFYLRGALYAFSANPERQRRAIQCWESVLKAVPKDDDTAGNLSGARYSSLLYLVKSKFEELRLRLLSTGELTETDKSGMQQELKNYLNRTNKLSSLLEEERGADSVEGFVVAFSNLVAMSEEAHLLCKLNIAQALEILTDSDPENDNIGVRSLARVFCRLGDKAKALTAFALLDRNILIQQSTSDEETPEDITVEAKLECGLYQYCDGCKKAIYSSDIDGLWWCQFCPNFDLCSDCKAKHEKGELRMMECSQAHVPSYLHLVHSKYNKDELEIGKVRINWEYKDEGDGKFSRHGGEVVEMTDWLEHLRQMWGLPEPTGDVSRAQQ